MDRGRVRTLDLGQLSISLKTFGKLDVERDQRRLGNVELDEATFEYFRESILSANADSVARQARDHAGSVEVARQSLQVAQGHLLHDNVGASTATNILLLKERIQNEAEDFSSIGAGVVTFNVGMDDELVLALGERHWAK